VTAADPRLPVLVGVAQYADRDSPPDTALGPLTMLARVGAAAIADCGGRDIALDAVAVVRLFADSSPAFASPFGHYANLPGSLARALGQRPRTALYGPVGGNTPQLLVNHFAAAIAAGEVDTVLLAGAEALRTQAAAVKAGVALDWSDDPGGSPATFGRETALISAHEAAHGIALPVNVYPLFENALGAHYGRSPAAQRDAIGALMAPFTAVASGNTHAAQRVVRSAHALVTPAADNRMIAYPYTKRLCANMFVDQAAAVLLMSTAAADAARVPHHRRVYLHGSADTNEPILVSGRRDYHSAPAIAVGASHALGQAGCNAAALDHLELYSCFPSAVQIAADAIGIAHDDRRGLTLTGGLPYFGGPGNNYAMHGIAEMVARCRAQPVSRGLVFANGGYLTKHSFGVYSALPPTRWQRADPAGYQAQIDAMPVPRLTEQPAGAGTVETFTLVYDRDQPWFAIIVARLADGSRALAKMHDRLDALVDAPVIGRRIMLTAGKPTNLACFAA